VLLTLRFYCVKCFPQIRSPDRKTGPNGPFCRESLPYPIFKDYVAVVDANFPRAAKGILTKIKSTIDKPIRYVLNTHYHGDHAYGNSQFVDAGATIIASEATDSKARTKGVDGWTKWNNPEHSLKDSHQEFATITFLDELVIDDGTQRVEMIRLGPAHSKGDSVA
jgi:cyclase